MDPLDGINVDPTQLGEEDLATVLEHLEDIKGNCFKIGYLLHLKQGALDSIRHNTSDHAEATIEIIGNWLKLNYDWVRFGKPSWRALVKAVASSLGGNNTALAMEIAKKHPVKKLAKEREDEGNVCEVESLGESISVITTRTAIKKLQDDFKTLVKSLKSVLVSKEGSGELTFVNFRDDIIFDLPESIKDESQSYLEKNSPAIYRSSSYNELFVVLNDFWNYLNPFFLQHVISFCDEEQLKLEMDKYLTKLEKFMSNTSIDNYLKALPPRNRKLPRVPPPPGLQEFITRHELSREDTLQHIEDIRAQLCLTMQLTRFSLYIAKFSAGSVIIMWYVEPRVAEMLDNLAQGKDKTFDIVSFEDVPDMVSVSPELEGDDLMETPAALLQIEGGDHATIQSRDVIQESSLIGECVRASEESVDGCDAAEALKYSENSSSDSSEDSGKKEDSNIMLFPTKIKDKFAIFHPPSASEDDINRVSFGRWLVGVPLYALNKTWQELRGAVETHQVTATGLKCSTGRYNPSSSGPGPVSNGVVSVYTTEEDVDKVGLEVIEIVKHDIPYKTIAASAKKRHRKDVNVTLKALSWNDGKPRFGGSISPWRENKRAKWHLNIETSPDYSSSAVVGYWLVECTFQNLTEFWHSLREQVKTGMMGPVKMECPRKERGTKGNPVVILFVAAHDQGNVQSALRSNPLTGSFSYHEFPESGIESPDFSSDAVVGYWHVNCTIQNLTGVWHYLRKQVKTGTMGPVKVECARKEKPVVTLSMSGHDKETVLSALKSNRLIGSFSYHDVPSSTESGMKTKELKDMPSKTDSGKKMKEARQKKSTYKTEDSSLRNEHCALTKENEGTVC